MRTENGELTASKRNSPASLKFKQPLKLGEIYLTVFIAH